ncbi:MAG TPA: DUF3299 domain-containing protein [Pirellulales bacterium]
MSVAEKTEEEKLPPADLEAGPDESHAYEYRELSGLACVALAVAVVSLASLVLISLFQPYPLAFALLPAIGVGIGLRAWSQIARSEGDLTGAPLAVAGIWLSALALAAGWGTLAFIYATEVPEGFERIHYSQLKLDENGAPPPDIAQLDGKKVFIKGYVYPDKDTFGIKQFILCRDNGDCCFGGRPPLSDMIQVTLTPPQSLTFHTYQFKVYGTFRFQPSKAMLGELGAVLYHIDDARFVE